VYEGGCDESKASLVDVAVIQSAELTEVFLFYWE
jgi:hypothetical protein